MPLTTPVATAGIIRRVAVRAPAVIDPGHSSPSRRRNRLRIGPRDCPADGTGSRASVAVHDLRASAVPGPRAHAGHCRHRPERRRKACARPWFCCRPHASASRGRHTRRKLAARSGEQRARGAPPSRAPVAPAATLISTADPTAAAASDSTFSTATTMVGTRPHLRFVATLQAATRTINRFSPTEKGWIRPGDVSPRCVGQAGPLTGNSRQSRGSTWVRRRRCPTAHACRAVSRTSPAHGRGH